MPDDFLLLGFPNKVFAKTTEGEFELNQAAHGGGWSGHGVELRIHGADEQIVDIESSTQPLFNVVVEFGLNNNGVLFGTLGDAWERAYGDLRWEAGIGEKKTISPWYFLWFPTIVAGKPIVGICGVKTGGAAMASWQVGEHSVRLLLDVRSGNRPVRLQSRQLRAAVIAQPSTSPRRFPDMSNYQPLLRSLCDHPRLPKDPIYGINDWYYAYGHNTAEGILDDTKRAAEWAHGLQNRPFSVIDDGWSATEGDWTHGNERFPDMPRLAEEIRKAGCKSGLWVRPLKTDEKLPDSYFMAKGILDPSRHDALEKIHETIYRIHHWGYDLIKHDYSTFDVCGLWGFQMTDGVVGKRRTFADDTRTTAEILRGLYQTIRDAAGSSLVLGCNTVGHLAAGLEECQRIGDDTSGKEWARTVKMGVNSLAYRGIQQGAFYEADPDCVGITTEVPWEKTKEWLELAANSGTVLFVSAQKEALGPEQYKALTEAFKQASVRRPLATPRLDDGLTPTRWVVDGKERTFDWS